ncbi:Adenine deaminase [uncultured spirochete]|uniref:Adenine deaminase n=1 Tax=uncultured spirochete TaxID=156406 RepID=A0A3P3XTX3_9SPIR|nr:Adenine deaminase [uncultured spirochete]
MNREIIDAATGKTQCDVNYTDCTVVDVLSGRFLPNSTVSVKGGYVAGINDGLTANETVDLEGMFLAPGLIDAHVHIESSLLTPAEYARVVVPRGTTTVVADPHEIANVMGYDGMRYMLNVSQNMPLDVYFMVPSCVPATDFDTAGAALYASDMHQFLQEPRVLGLGEVMNYPEVLAQNPQLMDKIALFKSNGRPIDGHSPGLRGANLSAYVAAGIGSDHECTTPEEALEKVGKGMYIMLREGSTAKDLRVLLPALRRENAARFMLCSDDRHCNDLRDEGHMDFSLRLMLDAGIDPIDAIRVASSNAARWFGIPGQGAVAPGYKADFIAFPSFEYFETKVVIKNGGIVARNGALVQDFATAPTTIRDSVNIKWLTKEDFAIPDKGKAVRVIEVHRESLLTGHGIARIPAEDGLLVPDLEHDILKIFVIERHTGSGNIGKGFIRGLGLTRGAIGSTISHDSHNMIIAGVDDVSIFKAARHLNKIRGGLVYAVGDKILLDLPLPVAGLMSDKSADFVIDRLSAFEKLFQEAGLMATSPLMTLSFMALPVIPSLKITDRGLVDVDRFEKISLYVD